MRPRLFLLALIVVAGAFPTGAAACSFVLQCEARHSNYDPLAQRAQPITIPFDSMCQSDPPPTAHEIRALASGAPNSADDSYEAFGKANLFAQLAYLRGDTAGVALAEKVVSAQLRILAAPDQKPRRRCQPEADCESARAHEVAGLHMSVAGLRLKLFAMTGERRWLDRALAEANLATRSNVHGYQSYGFDLTGQTIRSYVRILDPARPLYAEGYPPQGFRSAPGVGQELFPFGNRYSEGWRGKVLEALLSPDAADRTAFEKEHGLSDGAAEPYTHVVTWQARQAMLSPTATTDDVRTALVAVRNLLSMLKPDCEEAHLRHALTVVEAQLLARIARTQPNSFEARSLASDSKAKLSAVAALKDQPALAWRAARLLAAIQRRTYPADLLVF